MTTMIAAYNSDGCVGRCDAKCYDATTPDCHCICGGANHGKGKKQAMENTEALAEAWIEAYSKQHPEAKRFTIPARKTIRRSAMTDFIQELTWLLDKELGLSDPVFQAKDIKALVIAAADNTLKAAVENQHKDTLTKEEIAYIVAGLTVGIDPRIKAGLKPKEG